MANESTHRHQSPAEGRVVVVGVDGTQTALRAARWAAAEARLRELPLRILHAAPYAAADASGGRRAKANLARAYTEVRHAEPSVVATTEHTEEPIVASLLAAAAQAELLVVGMSGGDTPADLVLRSTALAVSGHAPCLVVVVRGPHYSWPADRPVLVGVATVATAADALTVAFTDARRHGSPVLVVHARHGSALPHRQAAGHDKTPHADAAQLLDELRPWTTRFPDVPVETRVTSEHPAVALLTAATEARLVVLAPHARSASARLLSGSTAREMLRHSPVPVAVVAPGDRLPDDELAGAAAPQA